jgi:hypothetical protein
MWVLAHQSVIDGGMSVLTLGLSGWVVVPTEGLSLERSQRKNRALGFSFA